AGGAGLGPGVAPAPVGRDKPGPTQDGAAWRRGWGISCGAGFMPAGGAGLGAGSDLLVDHRSLFPETPGLFGEAGLDGLLLVGQSVGGGVVAHFLGDLHGAELRPA